MPSSRWRWPFNSMPLVPMPPVGLALPGGELRALPCACSNPGRRDRDWQLLVGNPKATAGTLQLRWSDARQSRLDWSCSHDAHRSCRLGSDPGISSQASLQGGRAPARPRHFGLHRSAGAVSRATAPGSRRALASAPSLIRLPLGPEAVVGVLEDLPVDATSSCRGVLTLRGWPLAFRRADGCRASRR